MRKGMAEPGSLSHILPARILVCQQRQIGDVVLATTAVEVLRKAYPHAEIHFLTEKKCAPVLQNNPYIQTIWSIDKKLGLAQRLKQLLALRRCGFDLVIDFQQLPRCKSATLFSGAKYRLSYTPKWYNRLFYTHWIKMLGGYAVKAKLSVLRPLGLQWNRERPAIYLTDQERTAAAEYLRGHGVERQHTVVTVDATHWSETRRWPASYFGELIGLVVEKRPDCRFVLLYGPGEIEQVQEVLDATTTKAAKAACLLPPEQLQIRQTAAVMSQARLHLGNCSAPRHFALAVNTPTFTIIGSNSGFSWTFPAEDQQYFDLKLDCSPCNRNTCKKGTLECLKELYPSMVMPHILKMLDEPRT